MPSPRKNEEYLSVQWLEYLGKVCRREGIEEARKILSRHLKMSPPEKITVHHVGNTYRHIRKASGLRIQMLHKPGPNNPAHSGIFGIDQNPELIAELLLETIQEHYPAT